MDREVFRFVSVRPVQKRAASASGSGSAQPLTFRLDRGDSDFISTLRDADDRATRIKRVRGYVRSRAFLDSRSKVDPRLVEWHAKLSVLPHDQFCNTASELFQRIFDSDVVTFARSEVFRAIRRSIGDSIVASAIDSSVPARTRSLLWSLARACAAIDALSEQRSFSKLEFLGALLVLPEGLFPVAAPGASLASERASQRTNRERVRAEQRASLEQRSRIISEGNNAIEELLDTLVRRAGARSDGAGFALAAAEHVGLSAETKSVLRDIGITGALDVARAISLIENRVAATARLHVSGPRTRMVRIGANILSSDLIADAVIATNADDTLRHPGPCPPQVVDVPDEEGGGVTVPIGRGEARILGMADLVIVEQSLARYELSEIAHIENVLRSERRERRFRTATTTEESTVVETETTEEREKDLASTERFELQTESQKVINENATKEAGLTIHASYGPTVDATAKLGVTSSNATQHSNRASSTYARETTSRAVNRLQTRTMERRSIRTVREVEENNLHAFDNSTGPNISGVYRFVDKIYSAQLVNYGKRLMLEFVVPEPAAFWRHALTRQPIEPVAHVNPEPPGFCLEDGKTFVPLQAQDVTPEKYLYWAGKYGAEDIDPPPPRTCIVSTVRKGPDSFQTRDGDPGSPNINSDAFEVEIPDGYTPAIATVNAYGETQAGPHKLVIQIQDKQFVYVEPTDDPLRASFSVEAAAKLPVSINALGFHNYEMLVMVFCVLRREALEQWQLKTYFAIVKAYEAAKSRYDNAVEAARMQAGFEQAMGRNPVANREIERSELKRACISLASGQRFETFDAMTRNVAPYGYPEIDFAEAKAEARYVELFEQSFEWNNMTYLFYPYFWSRKDEWLTLVQLADEDPLFNRFLQAGAARVQVPVRPGFESVIINYLSGVEVWDADGNFVTTEDGEESELHLSIIAELKHQLGNHDVPGEGTVALTKGSDLVLGVGTQFSSEDENRRIALGASRYIIKKYEAPDRIRLSSPYAGPSDDEAGYSLGPRLMGEPWEVRVPTNLVKLDDYTIS